MEQVNDKECFGNMYWLPRDREANERFSNLGFAEFYCECYDDEHMDIQLFTKLVELDSKFGMTAGRQLGNCLCETTRLDILKV